MRPIPESNQGPIDLQSIALTTELNSRGVIKSGSLSQYNRLHVRYSRVLFQRGCCNELFKTNLGVATKQELLATHRRNGAAGRFAEQTLPGGGGAAAIGRREQRETQREWGGSNQQVP